MRTYQTVPLPSRSVVIRRPTASTSPDATPTSTMSPTPYWSSSSMNIPDRKSRTRFCAPNPTASPTIPAEARIGDRLMLNSASTITAATVPMTTEAIERSTEPMVRARCALRSAALTPPSRPSAGARLTSRETRAPVDPSTTR